MPSRLRTCLWFIVITLCVAPSAAAAAPLQLVPVGTFQSPTFVTSPPGDTHRLFVVERPGRIQVLDDNVRQQFLDLTDVVLCCDGERGLASIAFAPDYATSGRFYVQYTSADPVGAVTIAEYRRSATDPDVADPSSGRVLLSIPHDDQSNHDGGQLQFGPDGDLYIGVGDGGAGGDPAGNGQNLTSSNPPGVNGVNHHPLLGKVLRIDPGGQPPYAIPPDNPFPAPAREVFAYGLRNPWRFSFDRLTGDMVIADVGQDAYEEVDFASAPDHGLGANYGWNVFEGLHTYSGGVLVTPPYPDDYAFPVLERSHTADSVCSITGGYVIRDPDLPELAGQYVYADFCNPELRAATLSASGAQDDHPLGISLRNVDSFGEDACARVYVASLGGEVDRISNGTTSTCTTPVPSFPGVPRVSVGDASRAEGDGGSGPASFVVTLDGPSQKTVTVHAATSDGSATAPADYQSTSGDLSFAPGETSKTVDVPVNGDQTDEEDETFSLDLSGAQNAVIADGHATGTIADDDPAPSVSLSGGSVTEGAPGTTATLSYTATLSAASGKRVTVDYATADGTAHAPGDYAPTSGTLEFAPGETTKQIDVSVAGDARREGDETVDMGLSNPSNVTLGTAHATGTIVDDDADPKVSVSDASVAEGDSGASTLTFTVQLSEASDVEASVDYVTADGSARAPGDYTAQAGTLHFPAGDTSQTVSVTVNGDTLHEGDETLTLALSNAAGATIAGSPATGTIQDDDAAPTLSVGDAQVREDGGVGTSPAQLTFIVELHGATALPATVHYATSDGTAHAPADYAATAGDLTFAPGETMRTVVVPVADDALDEDDQTLALDLGGPSGATLDRGHATGTIIDDDAPPTVSVSDARRTEGDSGSAPMTFTVSLSGPSEKPISLSFATADGTATSGSDFASGAGTLAFAPGETTKSVSVGVSGDRVPELDESFALGMAGAPAGQGTIVDDDPAATTATGPSYARVRDVLCAGRGTRCRGVSVRAHFGGAGAGRWTFAARSGRRTVRLGSRAVQVGARGRRAATFRLRPGRRTAALRRRVLAQRHPVLHATLTFTAASGKRATLRCLVPLRR